MEFEPFDKFESVRHVKIPSSDILSDDKELNKYIRTYFNNTKDMSKVEKDDNIKKRRLCKEYLKKSQMSSKVSEISENVEKIKNVDDDYISECDEEPKEDFKIEEINFNEIKIPIQHEIKEIPTIKEIIIEEEEKKPKKIKHDKHLLNLEEIKSMCENQFKNLNIDQKRNFISNIYKIINMSFNIDEINALNNTQLQIIFTKNIDQFVNEIHFSHNTFDMLTSLFSRCLYNISNSNLNKTNYALSDNFMNDIKEYTPLINDYLAKNASIKPSTLIKYNIGIISPLIFASIVFSNIEKKNIKK